MDLYHLKEVSEIPELTRMHGADAAYEYLKMTVPVRDRGKAMLVFYTLTLASIFWGGLLYWVVK